MSGARARAARSLGWVFGSLAGARAVGFLSTLVLARLLAPDDFGVLAVPLLVLIWLETAGDLGTGAALVQRERDPEASALVAFVSGLALSSVWWAAAWLLADPIAAFFGRPDTAEAIRLLAWSFPLKALGNAHDALLQHELGFGRRGIAEMARAISRAAIAIALALAGMGAWALVWGQLAGTLTWVIALWILVPWRPWQQFGAKALEKARLALRPMLSFGLQVVFVNILAALLHHVDKVLVGRVAGLPALGLYTLASKLPEVAITTLTWAVGRVAFPAFARAATDLEQRRQIYLDALRLMAVVAAPAAVAMVTLAEPLVLVAFGPEWQAASGPLRWLGLAAAFRALGSHAGDLMKGIGRPDILRNVAIAKAVVTLPLLLAAASTGSAEVVAAGLAVATLAGTALSTWLACKLLELSPARVLRTVSAPVAAALGAGLAVFLVGRATQGLPAWADLGLRGGLLALLWVLLACALWPELRTWLADRAKRPASRRAGT